MVSSETRNARAMSAVCRPPRARSVSATRTRQVVQTDNALDPIPLTPVDHRLPRTPDPPRDLGALPARRVHRHRLPRWPRRRAQAAQPLAYSLASRQTHDQPKKEWFSQTEPRGLTAIPRSGVVATTSIGSAPARPVVHPAADSSSAIFVAVTASSANAVRSACGRTTVTSTFIRSNQRAIAA
jgi:hypothetical protein